MKNVFSAERNLPGSTGSALFITVTPLPGECPANSGHRVNVCCINWVRAHTSARKPRGRSSSLYLQGSTTEDRMYELHFKNWAVRLERNKAFQAGTSRPQNRDTWKTTLFREYKRFARLELRIYVNERQDGRLMSLRTEQKGSVDHARKSAFMGHPLRILGREVTRELCFRRLILGHWRYDTKARGNLFGIYFNGPV